MEIVNLVDEALVGETPSKNSVDLGEDERAHLKIVRPLSHCLGAGLDSPPQGSCWRPLSNRSPRCAAKRVEPAAGRLPDRPGDRRSVHRPAPYRGCRKPTGSRGPTVPRTLLRSGRRPGVSFHRFPPSRRGRAPAQRIRAHEDWWNLLPYQIRGSRNESFRRSCIPVPERPHLSKPRAPPNPCFPRWTWTKTAAGAMSPGRRSPNSGRSQVSNHFAMGGLGK